MKTEKEDFNFSIDTINKIRNLNAKLKKEEERIRPLAKQLFDQLNKQKAEKQIDDFYVWQELSVMRDIIIYSKMKRVAEENLCMEKKMFLLFGEYTDTSFYKDNWNEFPKEHALGNEKFCYSMHCLIFQDYISWKDIAEINEVWFELKVEYQFRSEV